MKAKRNYKKPDYKRLYLEDFPITGHCQNYNFS